MRLIRQQADLEGDGKLLLLGTQVGLPLHLLLLQRLPVALQRPAAHVTSRCQGLQGMSSKGEARMLQSDAQSQLSQSARFFEGREGYQVPGIMQCL